MEKPYILNPTLNTTQIHNALEEHITKAKAVLSCLLLAEKEFETLSPSTLFDVIWVIDDYVDISQQLIEKLH